MNLPLPKKLDTDRILKYVGDGANSQQTLELINSLTGELFSCAQPKAVCRVFDYIPQELTLGSDIKKHLDCCYGVLIYAVTLGVELDKKLRLKGITNVLEQVLFDAMSSVLAEQVAEEFEAQLKAEFLAKNIHLTSSYACGYGDYPLSILPLQLQLIDAQKHIGITLSSSGFMTPRKSICCVIGLSKEHVVGFRAGCEHCKIQNNCKIRKEGKTCVR